MEVYHLWKVVTWSKCVLKSHLPKIYSDYGFIFPIILGPLCATVRSTEEIKNKCKFQFRFSFFRVSRAYSLHATVDRQMTFSFFVPTLLNMITGVVYMSYL